VLRWLSVIRSSSVATRTRRTWLFFVFGTVAVFAALFLKLADSVRESELVVRLDQHALNFATDHRVAWISRVARAVTLFGSAWVVTIVITGAATVLIRRRRYLDVVFVVCSAIGTAILVATAKHFIARPRPAVSHRLVTASGAAFPSGHAAQSVACYAALAAVTVLASRSTKLRRFACLAAATVALSVGVSRVYLGVHWPSDVLSGWLLAAGWLLTLIGVRLACSSPPARDSTRLS
jgi:undecaprenyl-diphosphatase